MALPFILLVLCCNFRLSCGENNSPEWFSNISTSLFDLSGDILLGGLFPINELTSNLSLRKEPDNISCERLNSYGLGLVMVMKYAVDEINANQTLLPGLKLGYKIYDTCSQSAIIVKPTMSFLTEKFHHALSVECNYTDYETSISAVIGPYSSELVSVIAKLLGFFLLPQISFGATSDKFSDNLIYPSFFRTVPSDKLQVEVMVLLLEQFGWNWVAVVGSEEEYGQQGVLQFSKLAENRSICVAYQGLIPVYTDPGPAISNIIDKINETKVNVVVVFALKKSAMIFFEEVIRRNVTCVWIASTSWAIAEGVRNLPNIHKVGTIIGFTDDIDDLDLLNNYTEALLLKISKKSKEMVQSTPKSGYSNNPCPECWNLSPANMSYVLESSVQRTAFSVYAAVYVVAQALHDLLKCNSSACRWGPETKIYPWKLLQVLRNTSVNIRGKHLVFDSSGNPNIGYRVIEWDWTQDGVQFSTVGSYFEQLSINKSLFKWHTPNSEVPNSTCSGNCAKGQVRRVKGFHSCCFDCFDCMEGYYQADEDDIQCTKCPQGQWSKKLSINCTEPTFYHFTWSGHAALGILFAVVLLLLYHVSVSVVFLKHWGTPMVKAAGGSLSILASVGLMGGCLSLLLFLGQPGDTVCSLQLPLTCFFQTVPISIITAMSLQIFYVTEFPQTAASHLHILRGPGSWGFILAICVVQAGLCGWFVQSAPLLSEYKANMIRNFLRKFIACPVVPLHGFALMQGLNTLLALISFMSTFMAVKLLHQYNLARDVTFSTLIYCVIWVAFIPIYIGVKDMSQTIVHVTFILLSNWGLASAYYIPKCYMLLWRPDLNTPDHFRTFLEGIPPAPLEEETKPAPQPTPQPEQ